MAYDLLVIGAGINGAGIARDAAGRGLSVALVDQGDLGGATSSASTKLIHGGLRYLELFEFSLVRKALAEREVLLAQAPHIAWPLPFVLPHAPSLRPWIMLRAGLFLYDHLARRREVPGSKGVDLRQDPVGWALQPRYKRGFRYWDGWVDDSRLVVLNARDAAQRGATVLPRTRPLSATRTATGWTVHLGGHVPIHARHIINATGPWAGAVARDLLGLTDAPTLRLVQGAHIVVPRVHPAEDALILQQPDKRIVFVIPYEEHWSLIGTTERAVDDPHHAHATDEEADYLLAAANRYLRDPLTRDAIVHRFAGVRPLVAEPGKSERETTRDWQLIAHAEAPALTVVGGKLTTYRLLAEAVLDAVAPRTRPWTASAPLPGGDPPRAPGETARAAFARWLSDLQRRHFDLPPNRLHSMARIHGLDLEPMLEAGLGRDLGGVFEAQLAWFAEHEWATTPEDVLRRRSKLGLHLSADAQARVAAWFGQSTSRPRQIHPTVTLDG